MKYLPGKWPAIAGAVAAALLLAQHAGAATVLVTENDGTLRTINSPPAFSITNSSLTTPYGADVVTTPGGGTLITFSPTAAFVASATNATSGQDQQADGKLDFTLTFDNPTVLTAIISEGGTWSDTGNGFTSINIGGVVTETQDVVGAQLLANSPLATFNTDGTWTAQINLGTFGQAYSSYNFSIDNLLDANAPGGDVSSSASISKTSFSVYIPPPGGGSGSSPTPLPLAGFGGMGLGALALLFRKRLAL